MLMGVNAPMLVRAAWLFFLSSSFFLPGYFSPRRGYRRVLHGVLTHKKNKVWGAQENKKCSLPPTPQTCAPENFRWCWWGMKRGSSMRRPVSEYPIGASGNLFPNQYKHTDCSQSDKIKYVDVMSAKIDTDSKLLWCQTACNVVWSKSSKINPWLSLSI